MPKRRGIVFVTIGAVLVIAALLLFFYNRYQGAQAGRQAEDLLADVKTVIESRKSPEPSAAGSAQAGQDDDNEDGKTPEPSAAPEETKTPAPLEPEMPVFEIDGYGYVGYILIPDLDIELPVMSEWDYTRLEIAPCRHFGSSRTDDLVISAHNYMSHFGSLSKLEPGANVVFTDMDGVVNTYEVVRVSTLAPTEVDAVQNSGYDLVLYTCTYGGKTRVTVFCDRAGGAFAGQE